MNAAEHATAARIELHNTGSDLTDEQLARVFDRFYRADPRVSAPPVAQAWVLRS